VIIAVSERILSVPDLFQQESKIPKLPNSQASIESQFILIDPAELLFHFFFSGLGSRLGGGSPE
jgi:hypothetical protein